MIKCRGSRGAWMRQNLSSKDSRLFKAGMTVITYIHDE